MDRMSIVVAQLLRMLLALLAYSMPADSSTYARQFLGPVSK
jgi:hypothetical protein